MQNLFSCQKKKKLNYYKFLKCTSTTGIKIKKDTLFVQTNRYLIRYGFHIINKSDTVNYLIKTGIGYIRASGTLKVCGLHGPISCSFNIMSII